MKSKEYYSIWGRFLRKLVGKGRRGEGWSRGGCSSLFGFCRFFRIVVRVEDYVCVVVFMSF